VAIAALQNAPLAAEEAEILAGARPDLGAIRGHMRPWARCQPA
jgi:hypothetical protein